MHIATVQYSRSNEKLYFYISRYPKPIDSICGIYQCVENKKILKPISI